MSTPVSDMNRRQQFTATWKMAREHDKALVPWVLGAAVLAGAAMFALSRFIMGSGYLFWFITILTTILAAVLAGLIVFGRRAQRAMYGRIDGQIGAAASALSMLRKGWKTDPMVAFTKQQDVVHRVVGPPGIVLVGEGNATRLKALLATERKKHARVVPDVPIHEVICGNGENEVTLAKLVKHVTKLGRGVTPASQTDVLNRLKALDANRNALAMPKGPMPTSMKGQRGNQ